MIDSLKALQEVQRLAALLPPAPWTPDLDDPNMDCAVWTGKWYTPKGAFGLCESFTTEVILAQFTAAAIQFAATSMEPIAYDVTHVAIPVFPGSALRLKQLVDRKVELMKELEAINKELGSF